MEFVQIRNDKILVYAESYEREAEIKKLVERLIKTIKQIQLELK